MKCKVCGKRFKLISSNRYEVVKTPVGFNCLIEGSVTYEAFDCPKCGCQNIVNVKEDRLINEQCGKRSTCSCNHGDE